MEQRIQYLQRHNIPELIDTLVQKLAEAAPSNPRQYLLSQLSQMENRFSLTEQAPVLAPYKSLLSSIMKADLYTRLADRRTNLGVVLDDCIREGMDYRAYALATAATVVGAGWLPTGFALGDADCKSMFAEIFEPLMLARHGVSVRAMLAPFPHDTSFSKVRGGFQFDEAIVRSVVVRVRRNVTKYRFPCAITRAERRAVDRAFRTITPSFVHHTASGTEGRHYVYSSYPSTLELNRHNGHELRLSATATEDIYRQAQGDWPDGRSAYLTDDHTSCIQCNATNDHFEIIACAPPNNNVRMAMERALELLKLLEDGLHRERLEPAFEPDLGAIASDPEYMGAGASIDADVVLPAHVVTAAATAAGGGFAELMKRCHLRVVRVVPVRDAVVASAPSPAKAADGAPPAGGTTTSPPTPREDGGIGGGSAARVVVRSVTHVRQSYVAVLQLFIDGLEMLVEAAKAPPRGESAEPPSFA